MRADHPPAISRRFTNRAALVALAVLVAGAVLFCLHLQTGTGSASLDAFLYRWMSPLAPALAALVIGLRIVTMTRSRIAWLLIALGQLSWALGAFYYSSALWLADPMPFPSLADAGWLVFYLPTFAGVVLLVRDRTPDRASAVSLLDAAVGALAIAAAGAALGFGRIVEATGGSQLAIATNLSYPLGDLGLLAVTVGGLAMSGWRISRGWALLMAGYALFAISDTLYLFQIATETYTGGFLDSGWILSSAVVAIAVTQPWETVRVRAQVWSAFVFPATFGALAVAVLVLEHFSRVHLLALALASGSIFAVIARMSLLFQDNLRMLGASRVEATTDALTGLGNRRKLLADLSVAERAGLLVVLDLDGFKSYNDSFGHPAGDALLTRLGGRLSASIRSEDQAYRLGGDEFCVFVANSTDHAGVALRVAVAMREQGDGFSVTSSYGFVSMPDEATTVTEALRLADQRMYAQKQQRDSSAGRQSKNVLLRALEERNPGLLDHVSDVAELAVDVARHLELPEHEIEQIRHAAELHDVGKVAVPDAILQQPGALTQEDWGFIHQHTVIGERIISAAPALVHVARIVRSSHERWDGTGYPDRLRAGQIPIGARIIAVCDALAAMLSGRPYRSAVGLQAALDELARCAGSQFDPAVVAALAVVLTESPATAAA
ncbi:MAG: bifunctional diguanylate cyclase/phosphohydrolase [Gaiellaceae bacterium]